MKITSVYRKTIFNHRKSAFFWSLGIVAIGLMYSAIYKTIGNNPAFTKALESSGNVTQSFIGSAQFFSTPAGFIHGEFFSLTMPMILCIMAIVVGGALLSREEESHTIELILARPIARSKILRDKFFGMATIVGLVALAVWSGVALGSVLVSVFRLDLKTTALAVLNLYLLAMTFGGLALLITSVSSRRGLAGAVAGVYFLLSYIIGTFGDQVSWLGHFKPLSLFHYYDTMGILQNHISRYNFLILIVIILGSYLLSMWAFSRRDMQS